MRGGLDFYLRSLWVLLPLIALALEELKMVHDKAGVMGKGFRLLRAGEVIQ
jgi:hypothetical protein